MKASHLWRFYVEQKPHNNLTKVLTNSTFVRYNVNVKIKQEV